MDKPKGEQLRQVSKPKCCVRARGWGLAEERQLSSAWDSTDGKNARQIFCFGDLVTFFNPSRSTTSALVTCFLNVFKSWVVFVLKRSEAAVTSFHPETFQYKIILKFMLIPVCREVGLVVVVLLTANPSSVLAHLYWRESSLWATLLGKTLFIYFFYLSLSNIYSEPELPFSATLCRQPCWKKQAETHNKAWC